VTSDGVAPDERGAAADEDDGGETDSLRLSLAQQVELLWEVELGDVPMALRFEPRSARG
jgi:hypothetical protein